MCRITEAAVPCYTQQAKKKLITLSWACKYLTYYDTLKKAETNGLDGQLQSTGVSITLN